MTNPLEALAALDAANDPNQTTPNPEAPTAEPKSEPVEAPAPEVEYSQSDIDTAKEILSGAGKSIAGLTTEQLVDQALEVEDAEPPETPDLDPIESIIKRLDASTGPGGSVHQATEPGPQATDPPAPPPDLAEALGDEGAKIVQAWQGQMMKAVEQQMQKHAMEVQVVSSMLEKRIIADAKSRLVGTYPEVKQDAEMDRVVDMASKLMSAGAYNDIDEAINDAALLTFRKGGGQKGKGTPSGRLSHLRKTGAPTAPNKATEKPLTNNELSDRIAKLVTEGKLDEARRLSPNVA